MSWFLTVETESFLNTFLSLFGSEFADLDNVDIHGIWVSGLGRSREGLIGLVDRFGVLFGDFIGMFPLGLERDGFLISVIDGGGDSIHGYDAAHEGRGNASREISNKSILVSDAYKGGVVLEVGDILNKGWRIGVILPLGHVFDGGPSDGIAGGVMVYECSFKLLDEVREGPDGDDPTRDGVLLEGRCPSKGRSFGHIG